MADALGWPRGAPRASQRGGDHQPSASLVTSIDGVKTATVLELGFFMVIFTCMVLMRFGL